MFSDGSSVTLLLARARRVRQQLVGRGARLAARHRWSTAARRRGGRQFCITAGEFVVAEACLAKQTAVDCAAYVCDRAVQLFGGTGYMHGTEVERHYRDARILPIGGGADEVLRDLTAKLMGYAS